MVVLDIAFFVVAFSSFFTIINPLSTASVFVSITGNNTKEEKKRIARKASAVAALVLIVFGLVGSFVLSFFSITLEAFRIAGGILIAGVGFQMLHARTTQFKSKKEEKEVMEKDDVSIIPLAIPMMSGPGAMTTAIVLMSQASGVAQTGFVILAALVVCLLTYIILSRAFMVQKFMGESGRDVVDRVMGLIVLVVGVQFVISGVEGLLIQWAII